jgi:hypothetical protein
MRILKRALTVALMMLQTATGCDSASNETNESPGSWCEDLCDQGKDSTCATDLDKCRSYCTEAIEKWRAFGCEPDARAWLECQVRTQASGKCGSEQACSEPYGKTLYECAVKACDSSSPPEVCNKND